MHQNTFGDRTAPAGPALPQNPQQQWGGGLLLRGGRERKGGKGAYLYSGGNERGGAYKGMEGSGPRSDISK